MATWILIEERCFFSSDAEMLLVVLLTVMKIKFKYCVDNLFRAIY